MRILVDIGHPGHVHFFKNFIREMERRGHSILITARNKEITLDLLSKYHFDFIPVGRHKSGKFNLVTEWIVRDSQIVNIAREFRPDFLLGVGNPSIAHAAKLLRAKSAVFTDTEHAKLANRVTFPFASVICTPSCFNYNIGPKQVRYNGYHELAYLHPDRFTPDSTVLTELGLRVDDNIFLVRFVAFNASHDTKTEHFDRRYIPDLISRLEGKGTVMISSEVKLDPGLQKYQYKLSPDRYHDLLYFSKMYIGEGSTSAMEAAVLGVPSVHFERLNVGGQRSTVLPYIGVMNELQARYNLLYSFCDERDLLSRVDEILRDLDRAKTIWGQRREVLLRDKTDVTAFMVWFIEQYPASFNQLKNSSRVGENSERGLGEVV